MKIFLRVDEATCPAFVELAELPSTEGSFFSAQRVTQPRDLHLHLHKEIYSPKWLQYSAPKSTRNSRVSLLPSLPVLYAVLLFLCACRRSFWKSVLEAGLRPFAPGESPGGITSASDQHLGLDYDSFICFYLCEEAVRAGECKERDVRYCFNLLDDGCMGRVEMDALDQYMEDAVRVGGAALLFFLPFVGMRWCSFGPTLEWKSK